MRRAGIYLPPLPLPGGPAGAPLDRRRGGYAKSLDKPGGRWQKDGEGAARCRSLIRKGPNMNAPVFILPTSGPRTYRGKYPARARSVSHGTTGLHVELNNGTRLWTAKAAELPKCGADFSDMLESAVAMTAAQYETLGRAAALLRTRAQIAGHGRRAELESSVRRMVESIQPESPATKSPEETAAREAAADMGFGTETVSESPVVIKLRGFGEPEAAAPVRTIDATPTWAAILPMLRAAIENGTPEGRRIAWEELARMAQAADNWNASAKA